MLMGTISLTFSTKATYVFHICDTTVPDAKRITLLTRSTIKLNVCHTIIYKVANATKINLQNV